MKLQLKSKYPCLSKVIDVCWISSLSMRFEEKNNVTDISKIWMNLLVQAIVEEEDHAESLKQIAREYDIV